MKVNWGYYILYDTHRTMTLKLIRSIAVVDFVGVSKHKSYFYNG